MRANRILIVLALLSYIGIPTSKISYGMSLHMACYKNSGRLFRPSS